MPILTDPSSLAGQFKDKDFQDLNKLSSMDFYINTESVTRSSGVRSRDTVK